MKTFFINLLKVMMYSSFTLSVLFVLLFPFLEIEETETTPYYESSIKFWDTLENIINHLFNFLKIDFRVTQLEIFVFLLVFSLAFGFLFKWILRRIENI